MKTLGSFLKALLAGEVVKVSDNTSYPLLYRLNGKVLECSDLKQRRWDPASGSMLYSVDLVGRDGTQVESFVEDKTITVKQSELDQLKAKIAELEARGK